VSRVTTHFYFRRYLARIVMTRYVQKLALLGREKWIGWEIDGVGTEVPGLVLVDNMSDEELRSHGVKEFSPMPFESFLGLGAALTPGTTLLEEDIEFRLDALQVGMDRSRSRGITIIPRQLLALMLGEAIEHPRVQQRFHEWEQTGSVQLLRGEDCYLRITGRLA
jgi:hypothetical protein